MTKSERIMKRVRVAVLGMAPLLGLLDWQFNFQPGTSEDCRAAEVQADTWNHRATVWWNCDDPGYSDEDFLHIKALHELLHCVYSGPSTIHQKASASLEGNEECASPTAFSFASEEATASLARALWYRLIKPLWLAKGIGTYPQEWGKKEE
jgi:hypothetical protein